MYCPMHLESLEISSCIDSASPRSTKRKLVEGGDLRYVYLVNIVILDG